MNAPISPKKLQPEIKSTPKTTTVFISGNSQAVRLPKEFRVNSKTVEISRRGDEIVLRERRRTLGEALAGLPALTKEEAALWDETMKSMRADQLPLEERDLSWMDDTPPKSVRRKSKTTAKPVPAKSTSKERA